MVQFVVPESGAWTWTETISVTPPGAEASQSVGVTFRTVDNLSALLDDNKSGAVSNVELIRTIATDWTVTWADGTRLPLDAADADPLCRQPWFAVPIFRRYLETCTPEVGAAKNALPSDGLSPAPTSAPAPAPNRKTRRAAARTATS